MKNALKKLQAIRMVFIILGCFGILSGVGTVLYCYFSLRPKLVTLSEQMGKSLQLAETATETFERNIPLTEVTLNGLQAGTQILQLLPETLISLTGMMNESSDLLVSSAITAKETKEGIAGAVLPQNALGLNQALLKRTSEQLRLVTKMIHKIRLASTDLVVNTNEIGKRVPSLRSDLVVMSDLLHQTRGQIHELAQAVNTNSIPTLAVLVSAGFAGLYVFLGLISFGLAFIFETLHAIQIQAIAEKPVKSVKSAA